MRRWLAAATFLALLAFAGVALADDPDGAIQQARNLIGQADALIAAEQAKPPLTQTATVTTTQTQTVTVTPPTTTPPPTTPPPTTTPPPGCSGVNVVAPASLQAAINANPNGTTFCLSGTFSVSAEVMLKDGNTLIGPANIVANGVVEDGLGARAEGQPTGAENVTLVNLDVSGFADVGFQCWDGSHVIGGRYHDNDTAGIGCGLDGNGLLIDGAEVDHNGSIAEVGSSAAGMKFAQGHGIIVQNSFVHDNIGNGVWCDVQCGDYTVIDNDIIHNRRKGIHYEKSGESDFNGFFFEGAAYIARNVVQDNGWEPDCNTPCAGIMAVSSKNMIIEDNILGGNNSAGIRMRQDDRLTGDKHGWIISNVTIRDNTMNGDRIVGCDISGVTCSGNG